MKVMRNQAYSSSQGPPGERWAKTLPSKDQSMPKTRPGEGLRASGGQ